MAQLENGKSIRGTIGNVVFKKIGNKQVLQSKPDSVKQTESTRAAGSEFRQCSVWGQELRTRLHSFLNREENGYMHSRLNGALYHAIQQNTALPRGERSPLNSAMGLLAGFEFNTSSPFTDFFTPQIAVVLNAERRAVVTVTGFDPKTAVKFPRDTKQAEVLIYVLATNFESNAASPDDYAVIPIPETNSAVPETSWASQPLPEGHLVLVCAKLQFYNFTRFTEKHYLNSKECSPMGVVFAGVI